MLVLALPAALPARAQAPMPIGYFYGALVAWSGTAASGQFTARNADRQEFACRYDSLSYVEFEHRRTQISKLEAGDPLEVLADHKPGSDACYARIVKVVEPTPPRDPARAKRRAPSAFALAFTPRGDRGIGGVVVRRDARTLTLRTRDGERTLLLRRDTRYLDNGVHMDAAALTVNLHVFVRAGEDLQGSLEAYQVMWGQILDAP